MAVVSGVTGSVAVATGAHNATMDVNAYEWLGDLTSDLFTYAPFGTTGGKSTVKGLYLMTGTVRCFVDSTLRLIAADILPDAAPSALVLTSITGTTYTFNAHVGVISNVADMEGGPNRIDYSFTSTGDVTLSV